jgi:hypothetical protein
LHKAQLEIKHSLKRFNVVDCGRRFGKDILQMDYLIAPALEGYPVGWFAPTYRMLSQNWDAFKQTLSPVISSVSEQEKTIKLVTGGVIDMWSLDNPDGARGRKYKRIAINEAAMIAKLREAWNNVIRPTLIDMKGGAMFGSTPRGRNFFWDLYQMANNSNEWASWQYPTTSNPFIDPSEVEAAKTTTPELVFSQEFLAQFVDFEGSVFRRIQEAATVEMLDGPQSGRQYVAGVDVAASVDYTVITVLDVQAKELVYMDRFNRVDYNVLEDRLAAACATWKLDSMTVETNSIGQPVIDNLYNRGLPIQPFTTTSTTKQAAVTSLQAAFEHSEIKIVNNPVLIGELLSFESTRNASGSFSYSAPTGMHDDCVMSLAIAWYSVAEAIGGIAFV